MVFCNSKEELKKIYLTKGCDHSVYKLFPLQIEAVLKKLPFVSGCGVVVVKDKEKINAAIAFVHTTPISEKDIKKTIQDYLSENLPAHEIPKNILFLDKIPFTPSGKVDYRALERIAAEQSQYGK